MITLFRQKCPVTFATKHLKLTCVLILRCSRPVPIDSFRKYQQVLERALYLPKDTTTFKHQGLRELLATTALAESTSATGAVVCDQRRTEYSDEGIYK